MGRRQSRDLPVNARKTHKNKMRFLYLRRSAKEREAGVRLARMR